MSTIEEIKAAVNKLTREERFELFMRLRKEFELWTTESLQQAIEVGIADFEQGRFKEYDEAGLAACFDEIKRRGRERLMAAQSTTA